MNAEAGLQLNCAHIKIKDLFMFHLLKVNKGAKIRIQSSTTPDPLTFLVLNTSVQELLSHIIYDVN